MTRNQLAGTASMEGSITLYGPATCVIRVQGSLSPDWSAQLTEMRITVNRRGDRPVTELVGRLTDQAALHGVLAALYELGMPLLSVVCTPSVGDDDEKKRT